jgi:type IV secretory pathway TrbF-like protein
MSNINSYTLRNAVISQISHLKSTSYVTVDIERVVKNSDGSFLIEGTYEGGFLSDSKRFMIILEKDLTLREANLSATKKS